MDSRPAKFSSIKSSRMLCSAVLIPTLLLQLVKVKWNLKPNLNPWPRRHIYVCTTALHCILHLQCNALALYCSVLHCILHLQCISLAVQCTSTGLHWPLHGLKQIIWAVWGNPWTFTALYLAGLYCTLLFCTSLYCNKLYCSHLYFNVLQWTALTSSLLYYIVLHCTTVYCTAVYFTLV